MFFRVLDKPCESADHSTGPKSIDHLRSVSGSFLIFWRLLWYYYTYFTLILVSSSQEKTPFTSFLTGIRFVYTPHRYQGCRHGGRVREFNPTYLFSDEFFIFTLALAVLIVITNQLSTILATIRHNLLIIGNNLLETVIWELFFLWSWNTVKY